MRIDHETMPFGAFYIHLHTDTLWRHATAHGDVFLPRCQWRGAYGAPVSADDFDDVAQITVFFEGGTWCAFIVADDTALFNHVEALLTGPG